MKEILITSSVLIVVLLLLRLIFAKKVSRVLIYSAWGLVALRLLIPVQIGEIDFSILTSAKPVTEAITQIEQRPVSGQTKEEVYQDIVADYIEKDQTVFIPEVQEQIKQEISQGTLSREEILDKIQQARPNQDIFVPEVQQQVQQQVEETAEPITLGQLATVVWLAGVAVMAVWFMVVNLRHSRMLRRSREKLDADSPIPVYVSEKVGSPCLVGLFRPAVYLTPESAADPAVLRHVLTHELTHYRHMDHIWSVVRCVCLCVYWFDPLVWVAAWFSRRDCELACDEGALKRLGEGERIAYGKSLLDVVSQAKAPKDLIHTATSMNETKRQLKERVNFIVKKPKISLIAAICMVIVCAIVAGCAAAGPGNIEAPNSTQPSETEASTTQPKPTEPTDLTKWVYLLTRIDTEYENSPTTENAVLSYDDWNLTEYVIYHYESEMWRNRVETNTEERTIKVYSQYSALLEYTYDAEGKLIQQIEYGSEKRRNETEYSYDAADRLLKATTLEWDGIIDSASGIQEKILSYNADGRLQTKSYYEAVLINGEEAPNSRTRTLHYVYQYNEQGELSRVEQYNAMDQITWYMVYSYDEAMRTVTENKYTGEGVLSRATITLYDTAGNPVQMIVDSGENVTTTTYTYQMVEVPWDYFAPQPDELPYMEMFVIPQSIAPGEPSPSTPSKPTGPSKPKKVTYTVKAVDTRGNPVAGIPIVTYLDPDDVSLTDENGVYQWEDFEKETPFYAVERQMPKGYAYGGYTQEGYVYTILMRPIIAYTVKVVKENGEPLVNAEVSMSGSVDFDSTFTDVNGIVTISMPEDRYEVKVTNLYASDGEEIWTQRYEIPEGQTEATFTWVDDTVTYKVKVVDKNGNPVVGVWVSPGVKNMDSVIPAMLTDENGAAEFHIRMRKYYVYIYSEAYTDGAYCILEYGEFETPEGKTEVTIVVGEPTIMEMSDNDQSTKPVDAVFDTKNIVRITFYAYFGGGKGSDVPAENMAEIINWLNSFAVGEKAPEILPPGTGTWQVEIEYADGTVVKRSIDTITINGVIYYLKSDPWPEILEKIMSMVSQ